MASELSAAEKMKYARERHSADYYKESTAYLIPCKCGKGRYKKLGYNTYETCKKYKAEPKIYLQKNEWAGRYSVKNWVDGWISESKKYQEGSLLVEPDKEGRWWASYYNYLAGEDYREDYQVGRTPEEAANKVLANYDTKLGTFQDYGLN